MLLANGETPPEMSEADTAAWLAEIESRDGGHVVTIGRMFGGAGCEHTSDAWHSDQAVAEEHSEECERLSFSWSACDVCGSSLGGERAAVTFWLGEMAS
jgi:hypothetical protein